MDILCKSCKNFRPALAPQMIPHIYGYCDKLDYPFSKGIFQDAELGAFVAPKECDKYEKND